MQKYLLFLGFFLFNFILFFNLNLEKCVYSDWSAWSDCDGTCQNSGVQIRTKKLLKLNLACQTTLTETRACFIDQSKCHLCEVSQWSEWSNCSATCGGGITKRKREFLSCPDLTCENHLEEEKFCNTDCCKVDGKWSQWGQWSNCSSDSCESGYRKRTRTCQLPDCGGRECDGESVQTEPCMPVNCQLSTPSNCTNGFVWNECSNNCDLTCSTLTCLKQCKQPDTCKPGCTCPPGLVDDGKGNCIKSDQCPCFINNIKLLPNQIFEEGCKKQ